MAADRNFRVEIAIERPIYFKASKFREIICKSRRFICRWGGLRGNRWKARRWISARGGNQPRSRLQTGQLLL